MKHLIKAAFSQGCAEIREEYRDAPEVAKEKVREFKAQMIEQHGKEWLK